MDPISCNNEAAISAGEAPFCCAWVAHCRACSSLPISSKLLALPWLSRTDKRKSTASSFVCVTNCILHSPSVFRSVLQLSLLSYTYFTRQNYWNYARYYGNMPVLNIEQCLKPSCCRSGISHRLRAGIIINVGFRWEHHRLGVIKAGARVCDRTPICRFACFQP